MKKNNLVTLLIGATLLITSCTTNNCSQITEIKEHQPTSIRVRYETKNHKTLGIIVKKSDTFTCQDITIYAKDWLDGNMPYGEFDKNSYNIQSHNNQ